MKPTRVMAVATLIVGSGLALQVARAQETRNSDPAGTNDHGVNGGNQANRPAAARSQRPWT